MNNIKKPDFRAIDEFIKYIPEGNDIIRNTVAAVLHRNFVIEQVDNKFEDKKPNNQTLKKEYDKLKEYIDNPENFKAHEATLLSYFKYSFSAAETTETSMYSLDTMKTDLTYNEGLYKTKGLVEINGVKYRNGTKEQTLDRSKCLIYTYSSSDQNYYGDSRFTYNQILFELIKKALQKNIALLENSWQSNLYIEYEQGVTRKDLLSNAKLLSAMYAGHEKSGSPLHMPPSAKLNQLKPDESMSTLSYIDLIKLGRDVLRTAFNYPSPQNSANSTSAPNMRQYISGTINPEKKRYENFLNYYLVKKILNIQNFRLKLPEMKVGSSLEIAQYGEIALRRGVITTNELREELDFPKLDTRDPNNEFADKYYIQTDRWVVDRSNNSTVIQENSKDNPDNSDLTTQTTAPDSNLENNPIPT